MPPDIFVLAIGATVAAVAGIAVYLRTGTRTADRGAAARRAQAHRPGPLDVLVDLVDGSIGAYTLRQRLGRSTETRAERRAARARADALAAEAAGRWRLTPADGTTPAPPTHIVVAGTAASHAGRDRPEVQAHPLGPVAAGGPARQSADPIRRPAGVPFREGWLAIGGLALLLVAVIAIWPRQPGGVAAATGTPATSDGPTDDPAVSATPVGGSPSVLVSPMAPSPAPTGSASPGGDPTRSATPSPSPRATPAPTRTPSPTPRATLTPSPTATPTARPDPTPTATATPTPAGTATPTPEPTPTPSPEPTPTPEPEPTPSPTPDEDASATSPD